jgi:osmotically-inducible protein OsmY
MLNKRSITVVSAAVSALAVTSLAAHVARAQVDIDPEAAGRAPGQIGSAPGGVGAPARGLGDSTTGVRVQSQISRDLQMPGVRADVRNGVATLNGTVASEADKQRAELIARRVEGVTRVRNALVVDDAATLGDHVEQRTRAVGPSADEAVTARLRADTRLAQRDIEVRTRNDVVTLTGEVQSVAERETAGRIAAEAAAGAQVRNRLSVRAKE